MRSATIPPAPYRRRLGAVAQASAGLVVTVLVAAATQVPAHATVTTSNLLTGDTATLATTGTWTTSGASESVVTSPEADPGYGTLVTTTPSNPSNLVISASGVDPSSWTSVTPGAVYTGYARVAAATTGRDVQALLWWYDANGSKLSADRVSGQRVTDQVGRWQRADVAGIAPANAAYAALAIVVWSPGASESHYLTEPTLTATTGGSAALQGPFHTSGSSIYDANGNVVVFRGVNHYSLAMSADAPSITQYDIDRIKAWGANFVRLQLGEHYWLSSKCQYDKNYADRVKQVVSWINADGMVALLDLQWNTTSKCGTPGQQNMADYPGSVTFWQQVATAFKNYPLVAFDLYNEPHDISDAVWRDGGKITGTDGVTYQAAGMAQLYKAVRGTGAQNLVFASGNSWAQTWPTTAPFNGTNIVYAVHSYNCGTAPCPANYDPTPILSRFTGHGVPVMVTEFGWPEASNGIYLRRVINWAEGQGWGWSAWAWDSEGTCSTDAWWDLIANNDCGPGLAYEPSPSGVPLLEGLQRN